MRVIVYPTLASDLKSEWDDSAQDILAILTEENEIFIEKVVVYVVNDA